MSSRRPPPADPLAAVLSRLVEPLASQAADPLRRITLAWGEVCGPVLARHIEPLDFCDGVLHIGARHPQWRDAAFQQRAVLTRALRRHLPGLRFIRLVSVEGPPPPPPAPPRPAAPADPRTEGIADRGLRGAFDALLAARAARDTGRDDAPAEGPSATPSIRP